MIKDIDKEYVANTYARFPLTLVSGKGSLVYDENGKEYIDLGTGIAVNTFGIGDEEWIGAINAQLGKIQHTSNLYYSEPCANLAKMLCERTGMKKVFFSNSGAEANECAIKAARKYGENTKGEGYTTIITLKNSFHGRTLTTLAATGQDTFHNDFKPLTPGFVYAEANNIEDIKRLCAENKCCAVMFEVVQGEGGVNPLDREYLTELAAFAKEKDILLIADEVQIGNGRSGMLYGYMNYGITPDIVSTAKGLAGGLPIGATLLGEKVKEVYTPGLHGSTFGGNPISCAAAISIISRLDEAMLDGVKKRSKFIFDELSDAEGVKSVSGLGLMIGVETARPASDIISECMERGVLVIKAKNKVRMLPALNITMEQLKIAIDIFKEVCRK
ncbi:MAG: aspartate aminotransferase family protein [Ruminococcaceae bacterium]|nr:aspartate aminotransferase family protein [Oscillospiraceae bacterium]